MAKFIDLIPKELDIDFINFRKLEEIIALIVTKKELPYSKELAFFGWDDRYELQGKKGAIFVRRDIHVLNLVGLKSIPWNTDYDFIDFDQLLNLYQYAECMLDILDKYRHRESIQKNIQQINDLINALKLALEQKKVYDKDTLELLLMCIKG